MAKKKSAFLACSEEEVQNMERNFYCLQFGGDFLCEDRYYLFTKIEIAKLYNITLKDLSEIVRNGNEKDRNYALDLISTMQIMPFRLH